MTVEEKDSQDEKPKRQKYPLVTEVSEAEHIDMVREIFSTITGAYDFINYFLSLGRDIVGAGSELFHGIRKAG